MAYHNECRDVLLNKGGAAALFALLGLFVEKIIENKTKLFYSSKKV